ncbi:MAG: hypothetical protein ACFBSG_05225 [Leptolyngbyaceae cyanobacterium]
MTHNTAVLTELVGALAIAFAILCPIFCWVIESPKRDKTVFRTPIWRLSSQPQSGR